MKCWDFPSHFVNDVPVRLSQESRARTLKVRRKITVCPFDDRLEGHLTVEQAPLWSISNLAIKLLGKL